MQKYEEIKRDKKDIIINNFIGGIAWALGATIGLSIIIAILGIILKQIDIVPFIGTFIIQVSDFVSKNSHTL